MQELPPGFVIDGQPAQGGNTIITKRANPRDAQAQELDNLIKSLTIKGKQKDLAQPDADPNAPKLPTGFMWKDGIVGGEAVLIKGVPAPKGMEAASPAYSQSALDAFNRAISTADRLKTHPGLGAAVGSGFDPQSFGSYNPFTGKVLGGTNAAGFESELEAMKAQVFLPMVQSMKGMGALSNAEGDKLTAAIGSLNPTMPEEEFKASLDRIMGDLKTYRDRGAPATAPEQQNQDIMANINRGQDYANDGTGVKTGNNGFDKYVTEEDRQRTNTLQALYENPNTSPQQLNAAAAELGLQPFAEEDLRVLFDAKAKGERVRLSPNPTGERGLGQQLLGAAADTSAGAYGIAAGNAVTGGFLDEIVGATQGERAGQLAQYGKEYARNESPWASLAGDITGGFAVGGPAAAGVRMAGIKGVQAASPFAARLANTFAGSVPRAAITASTAQGALTGAGEMNDNRLLGAGIGGGAGLVGSAAGAKLASLPYTGVATNATNPVRGMFGGRQRPTLPTLSPAQQLMNKSVGGNFDNAISQMDEAQNFGLPMTLADADPALRSLAGSTVRKSPDARGIAEQTLIPRQRGQYDRLIGAIDRDLGPIANVPQLSDDLIKKARADAGPLYDQAYSAPGASSVDISGIIKTPIGQQGLQRAGARVQNQLGPDGQPIDPTSLGFDFNDAGETMLTRTPSFQQLDQFKQGLDDVINAGYDPISRQYTPEAAQAIDLKNRLVSQIDSVNPAYKDARAAYAGPAADRAALQQGKDALRLPPDAMNFQRQALGTSEQAQYGLGYRSGMAEQAGKTRYAVNPWETAYGTPQAQQKVGALFPEGADRFGRQYGLESQMAQTNNAVIGGSPTAERLISDANFDMGFLPTVALDAATTGTPLMSAGRLGAKFAGGELGRIGAKKKADALAPILFNADPAQNAAVIRELQKTIKVQKRGKGMFGNRAKKLGALAGGAPSVGFTLGLTE